MESTQFYQILALVFAGILPLIWNLVLRGKIENYNDRAGLIESFKRVHVTLGYLNFHHKFVSGSLVGIGIVFGIIGILLS